MDTINLWIKTESDACVAAEPLEVHKARVEREAALVAVAHADARLESYAELPDLHGDVAALVGRDDGALGVRLVNLDGLVVGLADDERVAASVGDLRGTLHSGGAIAALKHERASEHASDEQGDLSPQSHS